MYKCQYIQGRRNGFFYWLPKGFSLKYWVGSCPTGSAVPEYIYNFHFITILGKAPDEDDIRIAKTTPENDDQGATVQEEP